MGSVISRGDEGVALAVLAMVVVWGSCVAVAVGGSVTAEDAWSWVIVLDIDENFVYGTKSERGGQDNGGWVAMAGRGKRTRQQHPSHLLLDAPSMLYLMNDTVFSRFSLVRISMISVFRDSHTLSPGVSATTKRIKNRGSKQLTTPAPCHASPWLPARSLL